MKDKKETGKLSENNVAEVKEILHKNFPSVICQHCRKVTNIQFSNDFRKLIARNRTLSEMNKTLREDWHKMNIKNGQIEAMHKMIAGLIELIPEEHREKTKEITHEMRDEIKHAERKFLGMKAGKEKKRKKRRKNEKE